MSWQDYEGMESCIVGQQYRFDPPQVIAALHMAWFEEDYLHTATVDKKSKAVIRTFSCAYFMGRVEDCNLFKPEELGQEFRELDCPKGYFVGKADEDGSWYVFLSVSQSGEDAAGFEQM